MKSSPWLPEEASENRRDRLAGGDRREALAEASGRDSGGHRSVGWPAQDTFRREGIQAWRGSLPGSGTDRSRQVSVRIFRLQTRPSSLGHLRTWNDTLRKRPL